MADTMIRTNEHDEARGTTGISPRVKEELDLLEAAKKDHAAVKAARAAGEPIPATPHLDELTRRHAEMTTTKKSTTAARTPARTDIRYFHDGRSMSETHKHKLSTLAYFHSHDLKAATPARLSTKEFVAVLKLAGVVDPGEPGWMVKLPNGITVECRTEGEPSQFKGEAPARKRATSTSKKPTAKTADKVPASLKGAQSPDKLAPKGTESRKAPAKVSGAVKKQTPGAKAREAARSGARVKRTPAAKKATPTANTGSRKVTPLPKAKDAKKAHAKAS